MYNISEYFFYNVQYFDIVWVDINISIVFICVTTGPSKIITVEPFWEFFCERHCSVYVILKNIMQKTRICSSLLITAFLLNKS